MCGIVGVLGQHEAAPFLVDALRRLEYRGYDSAGIATVNDGKLERRRAVGKLVNLSDLLVHDPLAGKSGIGHTRWATHGAPNTTNAHPHRSGPVAVVHNGIIENCKKLREQLEREGHSFYSETDTEVAVHLVEKFYEGDLLKALQQALQLIEGAYSFVVMHRKEPGRLVAAKKASPLVLGVTDEGTVIASDVTALIRYTRDVIYLEDGEMVDIRGTKFHISNFNSISILNSFFFHFLF